MEAGGDAGGAVAAYERALMRRHRLELRGLAHRLDAVVRDLEALGDQLEQQQQRLGRPGPGADTDPLRPSGPLALALAAVLARAPVFFGEQETLVFVEACRAVVASLDDALQAEGPEKPDSDSNSWRDSAAERAARLSDDVGNLEREAKLVAPVTSLLSDKRDHLDGFVRDATLLLERSHAHRLAQSQYRMTELMESFRRALLDPAVSKRKQLEFEMSSIETSALTMLLPHLEICRTIVTANAEVRESSSQFTTSECASITSFVKTALGLKNGSVEFSSLEKRSAEFVKQLELFERAASKDAFLVCSTALKLQFQESLDKELFLAYLSDWKTKHALLQNVVKSVAYVDAMGRTAALKQQIELLDGRIRDSKTSVAVDGPTRAALVQEVGRLFQREGASADGLQLF